MNNLKHMNKRIEATKKWFIKHMLKISWINKIPNADVLRHGQLEHLGRTGKIVEKRQRGENIVESLRKDLQLQMISEVIIKLRKDGACWKAVIANVI
jgi:hypothetical protein